jgi:hypothetical protein
MPSPLTTAAEGIRDAFANFRPEKPEDFEDFFKGLPEFLRDQATSMGTLAQRADDEMPLNKGVVEEFREIAALFSGMGDKADELNQHFRSAHETELRRAHEPRAGEKAWNV